MKRRRGSAPAAKNTKITAFFTKRSMNISNRDSSVKRENDVISISSRSDKSHQSHISISSSSTAPILMSSTSGDSKSEANSSDPSIQLVRGPSPASIIDLSQSPNPSPQMTRTSFHCSQSNSSFRDKSSRVFDETEIKSNDARSPRVKSIESVEVIPILPLATLNGNKDSMGRIHCSNCSSFIHVSCKTQEAAVEQIPILSFQSHPSLLDTKPSPSLDNNNVIPSSQNSDDSASLLEYDTAVFSRSDAASAKVVDWLKSPDSFGSLKDSFVNTPRNCSPSSPSPSKRRKLGTDGPYFDSKPVGHLPSPSANPHTLLTPLTSPRFQIAFTSAVSFDSPSLLARSSQLFAKERIAKLKMQTQIMGDSSETDGQDSPSLLGPDSGSDDEQFVSARLNFVSRGGKRARSPSDLQPPAKQRRDTFVKATSSPGLDARESSLLHDGDDIQIHPPTSENPYFSAPVKINNLTTSRISRSVLSTIGSIANDASSMIQVWVARDINHCEKGIWLSQLMLWDNQLRTLENLDETLEKVLSATDSLEDSIVFRSLAGVLASRSCPSPLLSFENIMDRLLSLGFSPHLAKPLLGSTDPKTTTDTSPKFLDLCLSRTVEVLKLASRSQSLDQNNYHRYIILILFLALDEQIKGDLLQLCLETMWELFTQMEAKKSGLDARLLSILVPWALGQRLEVQTRCIAMLSAAPTVSSRTVVRWLSWSVLTRKPWRRDTVESHPPLEDLLPLFIEGNPNYMTFEINAETDYTAIALQTEILGHLLTDINGFYPPVKGIGAVDASENSDLALITHALNELHPKIRDIPSGRLERTRARDGLQRLSMQIHYQMEATKKDNQRICKGSLNRWLHAGDHKLHRRKVIT